MGQIQLLDEVTANQIAAGEVIERPLSVAKELIENSLDAGATQIDLHVDEGGTRRLVIVDDGHGMTPEDAVLCFSRYATSKLRRVEDLAHLSSFGFRGEALASIASVAKVRLLTRTKDSHSATEVLVHGGTVMKVQEAGAPIGTRIEIEDLFYNVPARLKFLKSARSEASAVEGVIRAATLSCPGVGFSLRLDGSLKFDARQAPIDAELEHARRIERAIACLGEECRGYLFPLKAQTDLLSLSGYVVAPLVTRKDSKNIRLYVNGRPVEDRQLVQALRVAYRTLVEVGRHPICALNLQIDPSLVDVNVHPQKSQVRFTDPSRVQSHLIRLVSDYLATTPWLKNRVEKPYVIRASEPSAHFTFRQESSLDSSELSGSLFELEPMRPSAPLMSQPSLDGQERYSDLRVVGQVDGTFLVLEGPKSMIVLDQHAAHERVVFERLQAQVANRHLESQPLLFGVQIKLSPEEMSTLAEHADAFLRYGFEIAPFGEAQGMVKAIPVGLRLESIEQVVRDALAELAVAGRADSLAAFADHLCAQIACHSSIRAGQTLQHAEIQALLGQLDEIDYGAHCPHGRPIVRALPFFEIARWFHRS